ncbi:MAG: phosphotransferase family protein [Nocardioidaceae bacterium]
MVDRELSLSQPVRDEDAFDVEPVAAWLSEQRCDLSGVPEVRQFPGGASNLTYELIYPDTQLILRRPPVGNHAKSAHDMGREFIIQDRLKSAYPYVPTMVARCQDPRLIGADFYVMAKIDGLILRRNPPPDFDLDAAATRRLCMSVVDRLVELHQVDVASVGLAEFSRGDGYVARQVSGWSDRFRRARTRNVPSFRRTIEWLEEHQPADAGTCLIHNDFRLDNVVLAPDDHERVVGVLDWEMATVGDPLMDVGAALAYWVEAGDDPVMRRLRRQPTNLPGMLTRRELWDAYTERTGTAVDDRRFYEVFGLFRLAVIAQQIYHRYHNGQTHNPAFRQFYALVTYLAWRCRRAIQGRLG